MSDTNQSTMVYTTQTLRKASRAWEPVLHLFWESITKITIATLFEEVLSLLIRHL